MNNTEDWEKKKEELLAGLPEDKRDIVGKVLEECKQNPVSTQKILIPVIRRVMPKMIAEEICGVQPMANSDLFNEECWEREEYVHHCTEECNHPQWIHSFITGWEYRTECPGEGTTHTRYKFLGKKNENT